jgi:hypothetical protein
MTVAETATDAINRTSSHARAREAMRSALPVGGFFASHRKFVDVALERAAVHKAAGDIVEPEALTEVV